VRRDLHIRAVAGALVVAWERREGRPGRAAASPRLPPDRYGTQAALTPGANHSQAATPPLGRGGCGPGPWPDIGEVLKWPVSVPCLFQLPVVSGGARPVRDRNGSPAERHFPARQPRGEPADRPAAADGGRRVLRQLRDRPGGGVAIPTPGGGPPVLLGGGGGRSAGVPAGGGEARRRRRRGGGRRPGGAGRGRDGRGVHPGRGAGQRPVGRGVLPQRPAPRHPGRRIQRRPVGPVPGPGRPGVPRAGVAELVAFRPRAEADPPAPRRARGGPGAAARREVRGRRVLTRCGRGQWAAGRTSISSPTVSESSPRPTGDRPKVRAIFDGAAV